MRREVIICLGLAAITLAVFWPVSGHDFINIDDPDYVTQNPAVQAGLSGPGLRWAFEASHANNWHPLTWLSHMLDCRLFGLKPGAHHLTNLGLHIATTLLLFLALNQMTGAPWRSALVAALFAWHPLHVESVAWVAERKDVLSAFFFMLTLWAWGRYSRKSECRDPKSEGTPKAEIRRDRSQSMPTAPHPASRITHHPPSPARKSQIVYRKSPLLLLEKLPFLALAAGLLTLRAQHVGGAITSLEQLPLGSRLANAPVACWSYLGKTIWPANLCVFYPHVPVPAWQAALCASVAVRDGPGGGAGEVAAVAAGWLGLGLCDAAAGCRPGPGRLAGPGRPLHLPALDRHIHHAGLDSRWPCVEIACLAIRRGSRRHVDPGVLPGRHAPAARPLAELGCSFQPCPGGDRQQLASAQQPQNRPGGAPAQRTFLSRPFAISATR